jgi:choline dehydrogenase-like flavoprotein
VVPSALGVNPQLTIMALATRMAAHLLGQLPPAPDQSHHEPHQSTAEEVPCPS